MTGQPGPCVTCDVRGRAVINPGLCGQARVRDHTVTGQRLWLQLVADGLPLETEFFEDHVTWTNAGDPGKRQRSNREIEHPVSGIKSCQPYPQQNKGSHYQKQHSNRTHLLKLLYYPYSLYVNAAKW